MTVRAKALEFADRQEEQADALEAVARLVQPRSHPVLWSEAARAAMELKSDPGQAKTLLHDLSKDQTLAVREAEDDGRWRGVGVHNALFAACLG